MQGQTAPLEPQLRLRYSFTDTMVQWFASVVLVDACDGWNLLLDVYVVTVAVFGDGSMCTSVFVVGMPYCLNLAMCALMPCCVSLLCAYFLLRVVFACG